MQDKSVYVKIGKNVRKYRLLKGLSQERLSEIISANDKFVGHIEIAEMTTIMKKLIKNAKIL